MLRLGSLGLLCVLALSACDQSSGGRGIAHENLNGVLWMQKSPEYWALTTEIYRRGADSLPGALREKRYSAVVDVPINLDAAKTAIIMDLDETVLDNGRAQGQQVIDNTIYKPDTWTAWVKQKRAGLVPGAKPFIERARELGIRVVFITNRTLLEKDLTIRNLGDLGIAVGPEDVLCAEENGWTTDKTERRKVVAAQYRVLFLVGDDLGDFFSVRDLSVPDRLTKARQYEAMWGKQWLLLPNPTYGSWERALSSGGGTEVDVLKRKKAMVFGLYN